MFAQLGNFISELLALCLKLGLILRNIKILTVPALQTFYSDKIFPIWTNTVIPSWQSVPSWNPNEFLATMTNSSWSFPSHATTVTLDLTTNLPTLPSTIVLILLLLYVTQLPCRVLRFMGYVINSVHYYYARLLYMTFSSVARGPRIGPRPI